MKNLPRGGKSVSGSRLVTRKVRAGSIGGSPKFSNRVRRLASVQRESLSSNHSHLLTSLPNVFQPSAHERKLRGSNIFAWFISGICFGTVLSLWRSREERISEPLYDEREPGDNCTKGQH